MRVDPTRTINFPINESDGKKGSMTGVGLVGFDQESDREALDGILQEVWEDESWRECKQNESPVESHSSTRRLSVISRKW